MGSLSALPIMIDACGRSLPKARATSAVVLMARSKMLLPSPTSFLTFLKVSIRAAPLATASSSRAALDAIELESRSTSSAVTLAIPPVDFRTAFSCALTS